MNEIKTIEELDAFLKAEIEKKIQRQFRFGKKIKGRDFLDHPFFKVIFKPALKKFLKKEVKEGRLKKV